MIVLKNRIFKCIGNFIKNNLNITYQNYYIDIFFKIIKVKNAEYIQILESYQ